MAALHLWFPTITIDNFTLLMLGIALLATFGGVFKVLEISSSGLKVQYQDLQEAAQKAADAGLLETPNVPVPSGPSPDIIPNDQPLYLQVAKQDANLALAGLRLEIERRLRALANQQGIPVDHKSISQLMRDLTNNETLSQYERSVLADMIGTLNNAVHGAEVDPRAVDWVMNVGPELLAGLDKRVSMPRIRRDAASGSATQ
jgi:hypothetical protein